MECSVHSTYVKNTRQEGVELKGKGDGGQVKNDDRGNANSGGVIYDTRSGAAVGQSRCMISHR